MSTSIHLLWLHFACQLFFFDGHFIHILDIRTWYVWGISYFRTLKWFAFNWMSSYTFCPSSICPEHVDFIAICVWYSLQTQQHQFSLSRIKWWLQHAIMLVNPICGLYSLVYMSKCTTFASVYRLHDFTVGVTHIEPSVAVDPLKSPHRVCHVYHGVFPPTTKTLLCDSVTTGRYLFVQIEGNGVKKELLTLCEVEVYGKYINTYILKPTSALRITTQPIARFAIICQKSAHSSLSKVSPQPIIDWTD